MALREVDLETYARDMWPRALLGYREGIGAHPAARDRLAYPEQVEEGVPVFVVGDEYLIAMKMVAGRPKDDADLEFLIADGGVDLERARTVVSEHLGPNAVDELERYCDEVAWRRSRGSG